MNQKMSCEVCAGRTLTEPVFASIAATPTQLAYCSWNAPPTALSLEHVDSSLVGTWNPEIMPQEVMCHLLILVDGGNPAPGMVETL